ncbi:hypothetical protein BSKO_12925 [Bryopsis sp. KO-2023]|nr:hypothetical protein BSKO_12925 [Bryopsis sp. KO-2023]
MAGSKLLDATKALAITTPKTNRGRNCRKLPCIMAKTEEEEMMARLVGRNFPRDGSKKPRNIVSSHTGAHIDNKMKYNTFGIVHPLANCTSILEGNPSVGSGNQIIIFAPSQSTNGIHKQDTKTNIHHFPLKRKGKSPLSLSGRNPCNDFFKMRIVAPSIDISNPRVNAAWPAGVRSVSDDIPNRNIPTLQIPARNTQKANSHRTMISKIFPDPHGTLEPSLRLPSDSGVSSSEDAFAGLADDEAASLVDSRKLRSRHRQLLSSPRRQ